MIDEGIELMIVGMGVVFSFLILLVGFMHLSGGLFTRFFPEPEPEESSPAKESAGRLEHQAVALAAAYRRRRGS